jgi:hypothetical protein
MGSLIRFVAIGISLVVVLGFAMFAIDEADKGSKHQQAKLERELGTTVAPDERQEAAHSPTWSTPTTPGSTTGSRRCSRC